MRALTLEQTTLAISQNSSASAGRGRLWTGRVLSGLPMLFLTWDGVMKLVQPAIVVKSSQQLGFAPHTVFVLGLLLLAFVALYLIPRTSVVGAVLLTGFLGGAVATHVRMGDPLLSHVLFPTYVAVLFWGGLFLRDSRVRQVLQPPRR